MANWFKNYNKLYWDNQVVADSGINVGKLYYPDVTYNNSPNISYLILEKIVRTIDPINAEQVLNRFRGVIGKNVITVNTYNLIKNNLVVSATYENQVYFLVFENFFIKGWGNFDDLYRIKLFYKPKNLQAKITKIFKLKFNRLGYCYALLSIGSDVYFVRFNDFVNTKHNLFFFHKSLLLTDYLKVNEIGAVLDIQENSSKDDLYHIVVQLKNNSFYSAEFDFSKKDFDYDEKVNGVIELGVVEDKTGDSGSLTPFMVSDVSSIAINAEILNINGKKETVGNIVYGTNNSKAVSREIINKTAPFNYSYPFSLKSNGWGKNTYQVDYDFFKGLYNHYKAPLFDSNVSNFVISKFNIILIKNNYEVVETVNLLNTVSAAELVRRIKADSWHPIFEAEKGYGAGFGVKVTSFKFDNRVNFFTQTWGHSDYSIKFDVVATYTETHTRKATDKSILQLSFRPYDKNKSGRIFEVSNQTNSFYKIEKSSNILSNSANKIFIFAKDKNWWNLFQFDNQHKINLETNKVIEDSVNPLWVKAYESAYAFEKNDTYELVEIPFGDSLNSHFLIRSKQANAMYFLVNGRQGASNYVINLFSQLGLGEKTSGATSMIFLKNKLVIKREQNLIKVYSFNLGDNVTLNPMNNGYGYILEIPFDNKSALPDARPAFWSRDTDTGKIGLYRSFDIVRTNSKNFDGTINNKLIQQNLVIYSQEIKKDSYNQGDYESQYWRLENNGNEYSFGENIKIEKELNQKVFLNWNLEFNWTVNGEIIPAKGENLAQGFYSVNPNGSFNHLEIELIKNDNTKLTKKLLWNENVRRDTSGTGYNENRFRIFLHIDTTKFKRVENIYLISTYGNRINDKQKIANVGNFDLNQKDKVAVVRIYYRHFLTNNKAESEYKYGRLTS